MFCNFTCLTSLHNFCSNISFNPTFKFMKSTPLGRVTLGISKVSNLEPSEKPLHNKAQHECSSPIFLARINYHVGDAKLG